MAHPSQHEAGPAGLTFSGFPEAAFAFFERVQPDLAWPAVRDMRPEWVACVHLPMEALLAELGPEFGDGHAWNLHRDPWLWRHQVGVVAVADTIALRVELSVQGLLAEGGWLRSDPGQVARYRAAVLADGAGAELAAIAAGLRTAGFELSGHRLSRPPAGFGADHPRAGLSRYRTLVAASWIPPELLTSPECLAAVRARWQQLRPLTEWLAANVGPRGSAGN